MKKKYKFRDKSDTCIKCVLVGDTGVGKSSLAARIASRTFRQQYIPTVFDNYAATVMFDEKPFHFSLFDTAGKEDYDRLRMLSYKQCDIFLVCFSAVDRDSLESVASHWVPELTHYLPGTPFILVATKADLRNDGSYNEIDINSEVTYKEGYETANELGAVTFIEYSALTNEGFDDIIRETIETLQKCGDCRSKRVGCCNCTLF